ncbi:hypothetical protein SAMN05421780_1035 [Flexibacter flexilis DSM 6793]|uniref:Uncharacterized protein n=1 Tax=Flexibacter flexilis DSM 6793 TaxID=927664 RepID=A0A1I1GLJ8_9BACT|nr:DUF4961 domain-containing protein [Flexibacter flexilis]SFC12371.1 hypothetical protein SAMN05421780_1035 [Flexibacter flexilis DSM 6793]
MKYYFSVILTLVSFWSFGQVITTAPSSFTGQDQVKISIDVTGTAVDGIEPLYLWTWSPAEPPGGNGTWTSSNETMKLTKEATNIWSITMVPSQYYGVPPAKISQIAFLVKAKDGSGSPEKKTKDLSVPVDAVTYKDTVTRVFPTKFTDNDVVAFYYNRTLDKSNTMKALGADDVYMYAEARVKNAAGTESQKVIVSKSQVGTVDALKATSVSNDLFRLRMIPRKFFNIADGEHITQIKVQFRSKDGSSGALKDTNASTNNDFDFVVR